MPHVMWQMQGIQKPVYATDAEGHEAIDHLVLHQAGLETPEEYENTVRDLVTFLEYLGEPAQVKRKNVGVWVLLFLAFFTMIAYLLKADYWRDVH
jgi:ubiquinol-cytochrome c reductase cytochrome c1 subunit